MTVSVLVVTTGVSQVMKLGELAACLGDSSRLPDISVSLSCISCVHITRKCFSSPVAYCSVSSAIYIYDTLLTNDSSLSLRITDQCCANEHCPVRHYDANEKLN